ncbi:hypothetical protein OZN62_08065 [Aurantiacibacter sp. MUD11]|uniref:hypothetical protein n=1 Tax=Aurantiacibacter sp. MUD11 TaxID=3003265 RepID=UPI0022AAED19|nr:hypothetical protein [Aurantiacibacter sp. MUD11]WAT16895.1 hypothetical protein OZN62_08065 [Aurantiacibacter sp. MUD11]
MILRFSIAAIAVTALVACSSPTQQRISRERRAATQFLERQGSIGDPGRVAAADFAFAKMAREQGTWTAFREYAAGDAMMDAPGGFASASELLAGLADPAEPIRWAPTHVWSSCDGTLAVSLGRFLRPNGLVGDYVTVWELQSDNSYRFIYDTGTPDDPQPEPQPEEELPEDAIIVEGMTSIEGRVADCQPAAGQSALPLAITGEATQASTSRDSSLTWQSILNADGSRTVTAHYLRDGAWQRVIELEIPAGE